MESNRTSQMKINLKKSTKNHSHSVFNQAGQNGLGGRNGATSPFFVRKSVHTSSNSSHDGKSSHSGSAGGSPPLQKRNIGGGGNHANFGLGLPTSRFSQMSINDLKSEKFSTPNSIIKERFFGSQNPHYNNNNNNNNNNRFGQPSVVKPNANNRLAQADFQDAQNQMKIQQQKIREAESNNATEKLVKI